MKDDTKHLELKLFEYSRVGSISLLKIFNFTVYERVGNTAQLFNCITYQLNKDNI